MTRFVLYLFLLSAFYPLHAQTSDYFAGFDHIELVQLSNGRHWPSADLSVVKTLFKNHVISDPYRGSQEDSLKWIGETTWEYRLTRDYTPLDKNENLDLIIDGASTDAEVFVNKVKVLSCRNQFRQYVVNVKPYLKGRHDVVTIRLYPSSLREKKQSSLQKDTLPGDERVFTRRAAYLYGWDFGPRFLNMGAGIVSFHRWQNFYIDDAWVRTLKADTAMAELEVNIDVFCAQPGNYKVSYDPGTADDSIEAMACLLTKGMNTLRFRRKISHPKLWWCRGYGNPYIHTLDVKISGPAGETEKLSRQFGIRTIELVQAGKPDSAGFAFVLNGVPVFAKGANIIPADMFDPMSAPHLGNHIARLTPNMNMLRVWGGGVYPDETFMRDCDASGIMVWQDLMFACAMYPGDTGFVNNVSAEVMYQVKRLRGHASLALWCGNNEVEEGWYNWGWQKQFHYTAADSTRIWHDYQNLFHKVIPDVIHKADPDHAYWPSSPSNGWGRAASMVRGDAHYWGVWWGMEPFSIYEHKVPRFMSEYGFQSLPDMSTWKRCCPDSMLYIGSPCLKAHQKHPTGYQTIDTYLARDLVVPQKLEDYVYASQFLQAWGIGKGIEAHRRARPYCMGTLFWQLNDCWPGASWSMVDYYGKSKHLFFQVKRLYDLRLISGFVKDKRYHVSLINDPSEALQGELTVSLKKMDGTVIWSRSLPAKAPAAGVSEAWSFPVDSLLGNDSASVYIDMHMTSGKYNLQRICYLVSPGRLRLQEPHITVKYIDKAFVLSTDQLALGVKLERLRTYSVRPIDNFVDLQPGEPLVIPDDNPKDNGWTFYSLYDLLKAPVREPLKK